MIGSIFNRSLELKIGSLESEKTKSVEVHTEWVIPCQVI